MVTLCVRAGWPDGAINRIAAAGIKLAQPSRYYHTGLLLSDGWLYQSRLRQGVHRTKWDCFVDPDWIMVACPWADEDAALAYYHARAGNDYDLLGLLDWAVRRAVLTLTGESVRPGIEDPRREICSEFNAGQLGFKEPIRYSPSALLRECQRRTKEYYA